MFRRVPDTHLPCNSAGSGVGSAHGSGQLHQSHAIDVVVGVVLSVCGVCLGDTGAKDQGLWPQYQAVNCMPLGV